ncbi:DNA-binding protein [Kribbella sp. CA-293567]|uniref:DNA-binding protein n=1 Tax=Kribbella sp. CA-293567 TaxID=3002436 RepID=UPI0022DD2619|nr:DNA-binding protein [Kribbella sp. CA-293567]WBQ07274.1 DNA-binding protein [Kribbella sp. CA-293567]
MEQNEQNLRQQTELYGEPLGVLVRRIGGTLGLTQARLAETIGLSAPMLSQLMSGQRVKIGNPAVVTRLHQLDGLSARFTQQQLAAEELTAELDQIRSSTGAFTRPTSITAIEAPAAVANTQPAPRDVVREIQSLIRSLASADEVQQAAALIAPRSPALADLLLTYGTGRTDDAVTHYERHR